MSHTLFAYADPGLTVPLAVKDIIWGSAGGTPRTGVIYLGTLTDATVVYADSDPGVDLIMLGIVDADSGSGVGAGAIKLALSAAGLDEAVPGDPVALGTQIQAGAENAIAVHYRFDAGPLAEGVYTDLELQTNAIIQVPV